MQYFRKAVTNDDGTVERTAVAVSADDPLPVNATVNAQASAVATAVAPSYSEGATESLSMDLAGGLRITGTINATSALHSTTADPSYVNNTDNAFSSNLAGYLRVTAGNFPALVDVNSGNKSNSTVRFVLATDQPQLTNALKVDGSAVTQPVSGAFYQATQPVSGTFWQATQPVSGTFWQATQPVSIATAPVLVAGSAIIGKVGIDQTTPGTTDSVTVATAQGMGLVVGSKTDAKNAATDTTSVSVVSVLKQISASVQAPPSQAVTNAGTFVVQAGLPTTVDTNSGNKSASTLRTLIATDALAVPLWGHGATAATPPANAHYVGMRTLSATPSDTTAQMNAPVLDLKGSQVVQPYGLGDNVISGLTAAMTGTTSTAVTGIGAPGSGLYNYITTIVVGNSHATVGTFVELQDGSGGTTFFTIPAAAVYGGAVITLPKPLRQPTSNTALYCKNTTTGANTIVSVAGFKGP